jgi:hypothetical protein
MRLAGFHIVDRFCVAEAHALRFSMTQIAFENTATFRIPTHGTKRTSRNTHFASDTQIMIDFDAVQFFVAVNGLFGADGHAGRIFTVLASHRNV